MQYSFIIDSYYILKHYDDDLMLSLCWFDVDFMYIS